MYILDKKYVIGNILRINLIFFHLEKYQLIWNIEIDVCVMFQIKYGLIQCILLFFMSSGVVWWQRNWYPFLESKDQTSH